MKDKVQKIRNEVERLRNELIQEREKGYGSDADDACILELQNVLTYIDSLQEEPVKSIWHDVKEKPIYKNGLIERQIAVYGITTMGESLSVCSLIDESTIFVPINGKEYTWGTCPFTKWAYVTDLLNLSNSCNFENDRKEESVSEDLIEATNNYCVNVRKGYPRVMDETDRYICNAFKAGAKWQKEQLRTVGNRTMSRAEKFIKDYTRNCSNIEYTKGVYPPSYHPWLTPDQARRAVEIAREETLLEVAAWISDTFIFSKHAKEDFSQTFNIMKELL